MGNKVGDDKDKGHLEGKIRDW